MVERKRRWSVGWWREEGTCGRRMCKLGWCDIGCIGLTTGEALDTYCLRIQIVSTGYIGLVGEICGNETGTSI